MIPSTEIGQTSVEIYSQAMSYVESVYYPQKDNPYWIDNDWFDTDW